MSAINDLVNCNISFDESRIEKFFDSPVFISHRDALDKYRGMWVITDETQKRPGVFAIVAMPKEICKDDNDNIHRYGTYLMKMHPRMYGLCSLIIPE